MASSRISEREEERRFNLRTLAIASVASATAAVVTSQLWFAGTWIAAALTPVLVALISELLHRPTERIAERVTADRPVLRADRRERAEAAPPPTAPDAEPDLPRTPAEPHAAPVRVYRSSRPAPGRRRIALGAVLGTGALALLIAVIALTVSELVGGGAIGKTDRSSTFFASDPDRPAREDDARRRRPADETDEPRQATQATIEEPTEEETTTQPPAAEPTPTTPPAGEPPPADTAPAPAPGQQP